MRRRSDEATVPLNWKSPPEWDRFLDKVAAENHGYDSPYAGIEIEHEWPHFRETHPAEENANRLLEAVGRRGRDSREKNVRTREAASSDGGRATVCVCREVKTDMKAYAVEVGVPPHEVLRAVVCWILDGGLLGRVTEKLERAVPEVEEALSDRDGADEPDLKERRTRAICKALKHDEGDYPPSFSMREYAEAVEEGPVGLSDGYGGPAIEKYRPRVLDRLNYREHPDADGVYLPVEEANEIAAKKDINLDAPPYQRKPYADLSDEERVYGLRIEAVRKAEGRTNGLYALRVEEVRGEVFDGGPSKRKAKDLMDRATRTDGFSTDVRGGGKRLKVDLSGIDHGLLSDAGLDTNGSDATDAEDVEEQMDALMNATPGADGGGEDS